MVSIRLAGGGPVAGIAAATGSLVWWKPSGAAGASRASAVVRGGTGFTFWRALPAQDGDAGRP